MLEDIGEADPSCELSLQTMNSNNHLEDALIVTKRMTKFSCVVTE